MILRFTLFTTFFLLSACEGAPETQEQSIHPDPTQEAIIPCTEAIHVTSLQPGDTVTSPLTVMGQARGTWYFEASFPVRLYDVNMNQLTAAPAQAQGEWMTEDFVPFEVTLPPFSTVGPHGYLFFEKDNPSDDPSLSCSVVLSVQF